MLAQLSEVECLPLGAEDLEPEMWKRFSRCKLNEDPMRWLGNYGTQSTRLISQCLY